MLIVDAILLLFVVIFLLLISGIWPPDSPWAPWWQTPENIAEKMCKLTKVSQKTKIYDLGCGTGHAMMVATREFGATCVGIEIDMFRYFIAKFLVRHAGLTDKILVLRENFFNVDLSEANVLFIYLVPNALKRLTPKFLKELKPGTMLISYKYKIPVDLYKGKLEVVKEDAKDELYLYRLTM